MPGRGLKDEVLAQAGIQQAEQLCSGAVVLTCTNRKMKVAGRGVLARPATTPMREVVAPA